MWVRSGTEVGSFLFPIILCFLSSKIGLKGCVYGQVAGEVCGSHSALEVVVVAGGGLRDPPLPLPLLRAEFGPQATLGLSSDLLISVHTPGPWPSPLLGPNPRAE